MYCLPICKEDPDEHIGNIFLSGGIEHGSKGNVVTPSLIHPWSILMSELCAY